MEAIERFIQQVKLLPQQVRRRLVVENDDRLFTALDVLDISERTGLPVVDEAPRVPFDCMLEAKEKDRALLRLRRELAALGVSEVPNATQGAGRPRPRERRPTRIA